MPATFKADPRTAEIPLLFLTANKEMEAKVRGLEVGGHDDPIKPVDQQRLARCVRRFCVNQLLEDSRRRSEDRGSSRKVNRLHQGNVERAMAKMAKSAWGQNWPLVVAGAGAAREASPSEMTPFEEERSDPINGA